MVSVQLRNNYTLFIAYFFGQIWFAILDNIKVLISKCKEESYLYFRKYIPLKMFMVCSLQISIVIQSNKVVKNSYYEEIVNPDDGINIISIIFIISLSGSLLLNPL